MSLKLLYVIVSKISFFNVKVLISKVWTIIFLVPSIFLKTAFVFGELYSTNILDDIIGSVKFNVIENNSCEFLC